VLPRQRLRRAQTRQRQRLQPARNDAGARARDCGRLERMGWEVTSQDGAK